jgi:hypothetical protein
MDALKWATSGKRHRTLNEPLLAAHADELIERVQYPDEPYGCDGDRVLEDALIDSNPSIWEKPQLLLLNSFNYLWFLSWYNVASFYQQSRGGDSLGSAGVSTGVGLAIMAGSCVVLWLGMYTNHHVFLRYSAAAFENQQPSRTSNLKVDFAALQARVAQTGLADRTIIQLFSALVFVSILILGENLEDNLLRTTEVQPPSPSPTPAVQGMTTSPTMAPTTPYGGISVPGKNGWRFWVFAFTLSLVIVTVLVMSFKALDLLKAAYCAESVHVRSAAVILATLFNLGSYLQAVIINLSIQNTDINIFEGHDLRCIGTAGYINITDGYSRISSGWCYNLMSRCCDAYAPSYSTCPASTLSTCSQPYTDSAGQQQSDRLEDYCSCSVGRSSVINKRKASYFISLWLVVSVVATAIACVAQMKQIRNMHLWLLDKAQDVLSMGGARNRRSSRHETALKQQTIHLYSTLKQSKVDSEFDWSLRCSDAEEVAYRIRCSVSRQSMVEMVASMPKTTSGPKKRGFLLWSKLAKVGALSGSICRASAEYLSSLARCCEGVQACYSQWTTITTQVSRLLV